MTRPSERPAPGGTERRARAVFLLWAGFLAFALPEVLAGTGRLWPIRPDVWLLSLPLYALHFLLLAHLALKTRRTSWPALYLFGIVFGLYESWITKVIWAGYFDLPGFAMGGFGPWFGVHETLGLVLFYHAITSFLLPLAVLTRLFPAWGAAFPRPDWLFAETPWGRVRRVALVLIWAAMGALNMASPLIYLATWLPMLGLIWAGWRWMARNGLTAAANAATRPELSRRGFFLALAALGLIYALSFALFRPERIPPAPALLITAALYPLIALLIWRLGPAAPPASPAPAGPAASDPARLPWRWLLALFATGLAFVLLAPRDAGLSAVLGAIAFVGIVPLGAGLFVWLVLRPLLRPLPPGARGG